MLEGFFCCIFIDWICIIIGYFFYWGYELGWDIRMSLFIYKFIFHVITR
jgi:hypothetical protein